MGTLSGEITLPLSILTSFSLAINSSRKKKNFSSGKKFFPLRVDPFFWKGFHHLGKQTETGSHRLFPFEEIAICTHTS